MKKLIFEQGKETPDKEWLDALEDFISALKSNSFLYESDDTVKWAVYKPGSSVEAVGTCIKKVN
jgi:hypothetical protein